MAQNEFNRSYQHELEPEIAGDDFTAASRDDGEDPFFHHTRLFDQNESTSGEKIDAATGLAYDNSTATDEGFYETTGSGH